MATTSEHPGGPAATSLDPADLEYFHQRGGHENPRWWDRFGGRPDLTGKRVADVGCGHGSMCVDMAQAGATSVTGFDLEARLVGVARQIAAQEYPELGDRLEYRVQDIADAPEDGFDVIISKDTFEHVIDVPGVLASIGRKLSPGGRAYIGFGPLWNAPDGDHKRTRLGVPWLHAVLPRRFLVARVNRGGGHEGHQISSIHDLGLNGLSLADYRRAFDHCGLEIVQFHVNCSDRPISQVFSVIARVPFLTEYFSHNIYAELHRPAQ